MRKLVVRAALSLLVGGFGFFAGCAVIYLGTVGDAATHGYFARMGLPFTFWKEETWLQQGYFSRKALWIDIGVAVLIGIVLVEIGLWIARRMKAPARSDPK